MVKIKLYMMVKEKVKEKVETNVKGEGGAKVMC